ncbi:MULTISPECIES: DUF3304 domain-containing protein [unclassified Variovorax]|uniref:DUF3304 domain-containing protein n=1 Tax=unclassified Variovorax TaxID=663243 RepID=UPI000B886E76|nr:MULTISPECIES: DUF3304 domain-containing protein [unclassified Variovorax]
MTPDHRTLVQLLARWLLRGLMTALLLAGASGCEPKPPEPMVVGITGYNFTSEGVQDYYVNGQRGSNLPPYGGGGSLSCCVSLSVEWSPGLTVEVSWIMGHWAVPIEKIQAMSIKEAIECCLDRRSLAKTVPIERYGKEGGVVQVFFLPNDEIKVYVSDYDLGHEEHPSGMAYPEKPSISK